jgi:hypothetical protein
MQPVRWRCLPQTGWKHLVEQGKTHQLYYSTVFWRPSAGAGFLTGDRISGGRALALAFFKVTGDDPHSGIHS